MTLMYYETKITLFIWPNRNSIAVKIADFLGKKCSLYESINRAKRTWQHEHRILKSSQKLFIISELRSVRSGKSATMELARYKKLQSLLVINGPIVGLFFKSNDSTKRSWHKQIEHIWFKKWSKRVHNLNFWTSVRG